MNPAIKILERLISSDFADLEGLQISGTIPIKQDLVNEALSEILADGLKPSASVGSGGAGSGGAGASLPRLDIAALLKYVTRAKIAVHEGEIRVEFEVRR